MLANLPAVGREVLLAYRECFILEGRCKSVVPTVEEPELRDYLDDLDDLAVALMLAQLREHLVGDPIRHAGRGERHVERDALGLGVERARAVFTHRLQLGVVDPGAARRPSGVRHAVAAAHGAARDGGDQPLEAGINFACLRVRDGSRHLHERAQDFRPALHEEHRVRDEAAAGGGEQREHVGELAVRRQRFEPGSGPFGWKHGISPLAAIAQTGSVQFQRRSELGPVHQLPETSYKVRCHLKRVIAINFGVRLVQFRYLIARACCNIAHVRHTFPREPQIVWVDVARLNEPLRLLGTAAEVGGIYKPAFILHEVVQIATGSSKFLVEVVPTQLQQFRADSVADDENAAQNEHHSLRPIWARQHPRRAPNSRLRDEELHVGGNSPRVRQFRVWGVVEVPAVLCERELPRLGASAFQIQEVVDGDSVKLRAKGDASIKRPESCQEFYQNLLCGVFGVLRAMHHSKREVAGPGVFDLLEELVSGRMIGPAFLYQIQGEFSAGTEN